MKKYTMIDGANNVFETTYKTAKRFFELHGGNSVLIIYPDGTEKRFEKLPNGKIVELPY